MEIYNENCITGMKRLATDSVDLIVTDPPYGMSFMGKQWDKALPPKEAFEQMCRVLKPGAFAFVMCAPRSDLQARMSILLEDAGFDISFTPIYWTFATGFPKAQNISKQIDKRNGKPQKSDYMPNDKNNVYGNGAGGGKTINKSIPNTPEAQKYNGAYAGYQPKPAVEVVIVAMKPRTEKTYVDQCLTNGHGITYLDNCRVPSTDVVSGGAMSAKKEVYGKMQEYQPGPHKINTEGRFPANLLVSDDSLNDGNIHGYNDKRTHKNNIKTDDFFKGLHSKENKTPLYNDKGSYSKYFDLDAWFAIIPKPSKREKNQGLESFTPKQVNDGRKTEIDNAFQRGETQRLNTHPTVKPIKLMSYLITLGSTEGHIILDPFMGSGTTMIAAQMLQREGIGFEMEEEYFNIAEARINGFRKTGTTGQNKESRPEDSKDGQTKSDGTRARQTSLPGY